jgi:hypothetical protein
MKMIAFNFIETCLEQLNILKFLQSDEFDKRFDENFNKFDEKFKALVQSQQTSLLLKIVLHKNGLKRYLDGIKNHFKENLPKILSRKMLSVFDN